MTRIVRPRGPLARSACLLAAFCCAAACLARPALADQSQVTIFDPPGPELVAKPALERSQELDQLDALGTDSIRVRVHWRAFAPAPEGDVKPEGFDASDPTDYPSGTFDDLDATLIGARARGMDVLLTPDGPAPRWATAGG